MISVILPIYQEQKAYLKESIDSIINQSYRDLELILIIDDPTNIDAINLAYKYKMLDFRVSVYINNYNMGLVKTLNRGLTFCKGEYIARMDADDVSNLNRLERQLSYLKEEKFDLVGCGIHQFCEDSYKSFNIIYPESDEKCAKQLKCSSCSPHPTWLVKKDCYIKLKGYREISYCEDYDFLIRMKEKGFSLGNIPEILLNYRIRKNSISNSNTTKQRVIAEYLARNYRKRKQTSIDDYQQFLRSNLYKREIKVFETLYSNTDKNKKISYGIEIAINKVIHKMYNTVSWT